MSTTRTTTTKRTPLVVAMVLALLIPVGTAASASQRHGWSSGGGSSYPVGTAASWEPSGYAPPAANALPDFSQSEVDDFSSSTLPSGWYVYSGQPGGDPGAQFGGASHISLTGGLLSLNMNPDG